MLDDSSEFVRELALDALRRRLIEVLVSHEMAILEQPHIVICTYDDGTVIHSGPYSCASDALAAAAVEEAVCAAELPGVAVQVSCAPLDEPRCLEEPGSSGGAGR